MRKGNRILVAVRDLRFPADPLVTFSFRRGTIRNMASGRVTYDYDYKQANARGIEWAGRRTDTVAYSARGIEWARGWDGEEVEAFKVAVALR